MDDKQLKLYRNGALEYQTWHASQFVVGRISNKLIPFCVQLKMWAYIHGRSTQTMNETHLWFWEWA